LTVVTEDGPARAVDSDHQARPQDTGVEHADDR
jgi:hypothetical protein